VRGGGATRSQDTPTGERRRGNEITGHTYR